MWKLEQKANDDKVRTCMNIFRSPGVEARKERPGGFVNENTRVLGLKPAQAQHFEGWRCDIMNKMSDSYKRENGRR